MRQLVGWIGQNWIPHDDMISPSVRSRNIPWVEWCYCRDFSSKNRMAVVHMAGIESVETAKEKLGNALLAAKAGKLLKTAGLWDNPPDAMPWKGILSALHGPPRSRCLPKEVWELRSPIKMVALPNWTWENEEETRVSPEVFDTLCKKKGDEPPRPPSIFGSFNQCNIPEAENPGPWAARLHNMVEDLKGSIRVFCRVRPLSGHLWLDFRRNQVMVMVTYGDR